MKSKPSRNMRALQRELHKVKRELSQSSQSLKNTHKKAARAAALFKQKQLATENENKIVRNSFTNFTLAFNKQRKELRLLQRGLRQIVESQQRNPRVSSKTRKISI